MGRNWHSRCSRISLVSLACALCLVSDVVATYWDPASPVCDLTSSNTGACAWTGDCILDDCNRKCVANTKGSLVLTPVWVLAARKVAVPVICAAAASIVYDRFPLPAAEPAENVTQRRILDFNDYDASWWKVGDSVGGLRSLQVEKSHNGAGFGCPSDEEIDAAGDRLASYEGRLYASLAYLPAESQRDAQQVENAEVWDDLIKVVGDTDTLKHFFKDYCKTDVVEPPLADMYQDTMSVPLQARQGKLLVCRDSTGHAETAIKGLKKILDDCLENIWNIERSWCLGDGGAYLTKECMDAYGEFLEIKPEDIKSLVNVFDNVQSYCGNEITEVGCTSLVLVPEREAIRRGGAAIYQQGTASVQLWRPELVQTPGQEPAASSAASSSTSSRRVLAWLTLMAAALYAMGFSAA